MRFQYLSLPFLWFSSLSFFTIISSSWPQPTSTVVNFRKEEREILCTVCVFVCLCLTCLSLFVYVCLCVWLTDCLSVCLSPGIGPRAPHTWQACSLTLSSIPSSLDFLFWGRFSLSCPDWPWTCDPLTSAAPAAEVTGQHHPFRLRIIFPSSVSAS